VWSLVEKDKDHFGGGGDKKVKGNVRDFRNKKKKGAHKVSKGKKRGEEDDEEWGNSLKVPRLNHNRCQCPKRSFQTQNQPPRKEQANSKLNQRPLSQGQVKRAKNNRVKKGLIANVPREGLEAGEWGNNFSQG